MAKYRIKAPDGHMYQFDAPDDITQEQAEDYVKKNYQSVPEPKAGDLSLGEMALEGAKGTGEALLSLGTSAIAGPYSGYAGLARAALPGQPGAGAESVERTQEAMTYQPRTAAGKKAVEIISKPFQKWSDISKHAGESVREITGSPGLATTAETVMQAAPLAAEKAMPKGGTIAGAEARSAKLSAANRMKDMELKEAQDAGYVVTPTQARAGLGSRAVEGLSGSAKMEKLASVKNQAVTNDLVKGDLSITGDQPISVSVLQDIRKRSGAAYEAVKSSVKAIKPDAQFKKDLDALRGDYSNAAREYPDLIKNAEIEKLISSLDVTASPRSMIELTRKLRRDATANLRAYDNPEKQALGFAQRNAATAVEEQIDRALSSVGKGNLVAEFRQARELIAKTHDVEAALNETTGDVSARYLGKLYDKGRPLTGGMEKAARFSRAFDKSARDIVKMADQSEFGWGDLMLGTAAEAIGHATTGSFGGMAAIGARPAARHVILSKPYQRAFLGPPDYGPSSLQKMKDFFARVQGQPGAGMIEMDLEQQQKK